MIKQLLDATFKKLVMETENNNKTIHGSFVFFVNEVLEKRFNTPNLIGERTMIDYYKKHVKGKQNNSKEPSYKLKNYMANYLGYDNFSNFEISKRKDSLTTVSNSFDYIYNKTQIIPATFLITITVGIIYFYNSSHKSYIK